MKPLRVGKTVERKFIRLARKAFPDMKFSSLCEFTGNPLICGVWVRNRDYLHGSQLFASKQYLEKIADAMKLSGMAVEINTASLCRDDWYILGTVNTYTSFQEQECYGCGKKTAADPFRIEFPLSSRAVVVRLCPKCAEKYKKSVVKQLTAVSLWERILGLFWKP